MKYSLILLPLIASIALVGCKPATETSSTSSSAANASNASQNAAQQMQVYTYEQKEAYVAAMQQQLTEMNKSLDTLAATIDQSSAAAKADAAPKLAALRAQAVQLQKQLNEVNNATSSTWNGIKNDSEKLYTALKDGITQSRQWASDKIAP